MSMTKSPSNHPPILNLAFRPFFFLATFYAVFIIVIWGFAYSGKLNLHAPGMSIFQWHAHEMLYGYCLAVITGFLLTASKTWTGQQTLHGRPLALLALVWVVARLCWIIPSETIRLLASIIDGLFLLLVTVAVAWPILKVKQYAQIGLVSKLAFFFIGSVIVTVGLYTRHHQLIHIGIYLPLYLVLGVVLTIGRRVIPFFIERALAHDGIDGKPRNSRWLDRLSLLCFLSFFISELFTQLQWLSALLALLTGAVIGFRLIGWHHPHIWRKPLLWGLWLAILWIVIGFMIYAANSWTHSSPYVAIHAWTYGGIGTITLAMMARVSLGHTGRNIHSPSPWITAALLILTSGAVVRVILPLIFPAHYILWIILADVAWVLAFSILLLVYIPIWFTARIDGKYG